MNKEENKVEENKVEEKENNHHQYSSNPMNTTTTTTKNTFIHFLLWMKEDEKEEEEDTDKKTTPMNKNNHHHPSHGQEEEEEIKKISYKVLGSEGYVIHITIHNIYVYAYTQEGIFRSIQTLVQLFPSTSFTSSSSTKNMNIYEKIPCGIIIDYPTFLYRGIMIDVARHFFPISTIQSIIDIISLYKMNYLHLHLSDDQGWRIDIPSYPNLTLLGGQGQVFNERNSFPTTTTNTTTTNTRLYYTQEEYKQLIQYAQEKFITIIPEIDMPGHVNAILYSYPDLLSCNNNNNIEPFTGTFGGFSSLCLSNNNTWTFVQQVLQDIMDITPGPYIHIGADEVFSLNVQDYCTFLKFAGQVIESYNKIMIGWDDIGECDFNITPSFMIQWWRNWEDGERKVKAGVMRGHSIIMSPAKMTYLDMKYNEHTMLGQSSVGYIEIDKTYQWNPETILPGVEKEHILGVEAPLWTEFIYTKEDIDYMIFPRSIALAEVGWTPMVQRNWDDFRKRLRNHYDRLTSLNVQFYKSPLI